MADYGRCVLKREESAKKTASAVELGFQLSLPLFLPIKAGVGQAPLRWVFFLQITEGAC
jgi:hypothetical protein